MSRVTLITADKPLPLCDYEENRTKIVRLPDTLEDPEWRGKELSVTAPAGFVVHEHNYYRPAVDALGLSMKSYQYELGMEVHETDLAHLLKYLRDNFSPGEEVELWNLWVGWDPGPMNRLQLGLSELDMGLLEQFLEPHEEDDDVISQAFLNIKI